MNKTGTGFQYLPKIDKSNTVSSLDPPPQSYEKMLKEANFSSS